mmetsp:Transcript_72534/g.204553  ORF Transcript_72534/g.204553 Transcript_72534/m.204553 type:complete len:203 (-) Transcript_72534:224-832(-)
MRILHELLAELPGLSRHRRAEHHDLLLLWGLNEDLLNVLTHVELVHALVALVEDELSELVQLQALLPDQGEQPSWSSDEDVGAAVLQHLLVLGDGDTTVHYASLHGREILGEAVELMLDLVCELARVADDKHLHGLLRGIHLLQAREHEDGRLAHAGLGLAENVSAQDGLRDALMLDLGGVLEAAVHDGAEELGLQEEVAEA